MGKVLLCITSLLICLFASRTAVFAQKMPWAEGYGSGDDLIIQLVTIDPGKQVYTWWGHTALVVTDIRLGLSRFYNYGLFNFEQNGFFRNFAMGRLVFEVGSMPTQTALEHYRDENRSIRIQTLSISAPAKVRVAQFLETNVLPQNRQYLYDHYYDNCATRVRDILDMATEGQLIAFTEDSAEITFREITRRYTHRYWIMEAFLMFLMSDVIDRNITQWETMFLPAELERYVDTLLIYDRNGNERPFVTETKTWYSAVDQENIPERAGSAVPRMLLMGMSFGLAIGLMSVFLKQRGFRIFYGATSIVAGLAIGISGALLFFMSLFTNHTVTFWNENLFFANVFTFLAVPLGTMAAFGRLRKALFWMWSIHLAGAVLLIVLKLLPIFNQENWPNIALVMPIYIGFAAGGYYRIMRKTGSQ